MGVVATSLSNKEYKNAYLLYGAEGYLRNYYKKALKVALVNDGDNLNYSYFEGAGTNPTEVAGLLSTMPFMAEHRVIIVENSGWMSKSSGDDEASGKSSGDGKLSTVIDGIKNISEDVIIIFAEEKVDKRSKLYKAITSKGVAEEFDVQGEENLARWLMNQAKASGKTMTPATAMYLVSECGKDMFLLEKEMDKLIAWCLDRTGITVEDVDTVCTHQVNNKIFDMVTAIALHRQKEALALYYDLLVLRESPFHILTLLVRQYERMLAIKDATQKKVPLSSLCGRLEMQDWLVKKIADQTRNISYKEIRRNLEACAKADEDIKNGNLTDSMSLELLIVGCSMPA
ncbi:MAG: DNA polymerase III subunit delta [Lachnospiraceae bacterium]|nr:DNA polymerase III subunit delta [Lachnospiraceae bacterium]